MSKPLQTVRARYDALVASGAVERDEAQLAAVERLDALAVEIVSRGNLRPRRSGLLGKLFGEPKGDPPPRGLYVWGEVGRGKTMLMDLFYESLPGSSKRRAHFHAYMADVHERIHAWREKLKAGEVSGDDPIRPVAAALADEARILCFDEFAVTDIADAMILGRLFTALFERGVVVVATSNVPPDGLYKDGLNRALFLPFIKLLSERTEVLNLRSRTDFRMEKVGDSPVFFTPIDDEARRGMDELFRRLTGGAATAPATLTVYGHPVEVPAQVGGVARFRFEDLCSKPLAASDFLAIARAYHTIFVDDIPRLAFERRNEARRFIMLIDVLYERHSRLVASAATPPDALYEGRAGAETFEFARTASRLHEMNSRSYWATARAETVTGSTTGLVET
ncbi:cell division protein ZapE [Enterovirga rhinocerotis]|uniref:Cell division protein ZapE n=1 Tax=Enterovirga rhinocerotis TaxID=1339210 RepID=A0A4R7BK88_9HYPH|nr:cell division protein ZapE [Enterovirga rhinocerotis]TDR85443.1 cell division protein ZapE [Enterovirga rhinocerotis]